MTLRFLVAGLLLAVYARARGRALPVTWADWRPIVLLGFLTNALYLGLSAFSMTALSSGTVAILASTNPLILALIAPWVLGEPLTARKAAGLAAGFLVVVNAGQLLAAGLLLAPPALLLERVGDIHWTWPFVAAQAFVIVGASWLGALIWFWLLRQGDASRASAYFFLNPVLGVFFGAILLGEPLGVADFGGAPVVALGIYVVQRAP